MSEEEEPRIYWDFDGPEICYAEVDDNNIVTGDNLVISAEDAPDEATGQTFCRNLLNSTNKFIRAYKTKPSINPRKCFPGEGHIYDPVNDWFKVPVPSLDPDDLYLEVYDDDMNRSMAYDYRGKTFTWDDENWNYILE
tara:strand:- start:684 stop:1097 length:414 start_codon:yes stop_codon:yes gene_type:complete